MANKIVFWNIFRNKIKNKFCIQIMNFSHINIKMRAKIEFRQKVQLFNLSISKNLRFKEIVSDALHNISISEHRRVF